MGVGANKHVVERFYEELWNRGNFDAADELVSPDYIRHDLRPGDAPPGPAGQKSVAERFRAAFPDVGLEVEALIAEGDLVAARWTMSGTHTGPWGDVAATGRKVRFSGVNFFRVVDGKIAEIWNTGRPRSTGAARRRRIRGLPRAGRQLTRASPATSGCRETAR